jgi:hypothetical protein
MARNRVTCEPERRGPLAQMRERLSEIREWLAATERNPDMYLSPRDRTLWTRGELFDLFRRYSPETPLSVDAFGRGLGRFGRSLVNRGTLAAASAP